MTQRANPSIPDIHTSIQYPMPTTRHSVPGAPPAARPRRIAIDLVPIRVGDGGAGSGIWTYARELLLALDRQDLSGMEVLCLVNAGQAPFLDGLHQLACIVVRKTPRSVLKRLWWIHVHLPILCLVKQIDVLHKLATETPLWCPARRVTTVHDFYYEFIFAHRPPEQIRFHQRLENRYFSFATQLCFHKSMAIVSVSDATRQEAIRRFPGSSGRIRVIHHGAPDAPPNARGPTPMATPFTILCVAKFMPHKGQHLLVDAFERMMEAHPECVDRVVLVLRGFHNDEAYYGQLRRQICASRYGQQIRIVAFDPQDGIATIYREADLVVLLSEFEGFGLPLLEAQSQCVPVLCSDLPVLREVGGQGAVYVDRADPEAIACALYRFVDDPAFCDQMRHAGRFNLARFSWDEAARKTAEIYQTV